MSRMRLRRTLHRVDLRCRGGSNGGHDVRAGVFWINTDEPGMPLRSRLTPGGGAVPDGVESVVLGCRMCGTVKTVSLPAIREWLFGRLVDGFHANTTVWPINGRSRAFESGIVDASSSTV